MTQKQRYKAAQLLKAGQVVELNGDFFRAVHFEGDYWSNPCMICDLDSICRDEVFEVCCELETKASHHWLLRLAHPL